jgi:hypothetical protein
MNRKSFLTGAIALLATGISTAAMAQAIPATIDHRPSTSR